MNSEREDSRHVDDFYVGYRPDAPLALAGWLKGLIFGLLVTAVSLAAVAALLQDRFATGRFEFGVVKSFAGVVQIDPYPILYASRPDARSYLLVAPGKHGAGKWLNGLDGREVSLQGSLIHHLDRAMIELQPDSVGPVDGTPGDIVAGSRTPAQGRPDTVVDLGEHTLRGEIVDSKCFLGVMKPGRLKPHRACATLCISGGIPPMLLVETSKGQLSLLLLVDVAGNSVNEQVLPYVAEPVEITGSVQRRGEQLVFLADLDSLRRL